jgi:glycosyltransferase involved in cell wall biosynthesis
VVVLMMGTIEPRKAQTILTQAFERIVADHPKSLLILVGDQLTDYSAALRRYLDERGLKERVRLAPVLEEIYPWYRAADLFVCASDVESMPRSVLEAMAFGTPVVATDVFGIPELIEDGRTGWLFAPRSVRDAAGALDRALSSDGDTRASIGRAGREVVRRRHDSRGYSTEIVALLRRMIASPGVSANQHLEALRSEGVDVRSHAIGTSARALTFDEDEQHATPSDLT